ncbi:hypothetical protein B0H16DRAFT_308515 [Mycena metata]|uniref:Uncharacterized protein n=1 Tax=Mycena metata TaxID=1033252 RepID=A0AAD7KJW0_9AGAR|nr:hypothetical protein B0H16DRAFT_308515 [Mycena metata]
MPFHRIFRSAAPDDWVSPLITVARGLVPVANCVPFPYVTVALTAGLALLELIQTVGKSSEDLKYLAESVTTIMKLLREEVDAHPTTEDTRFKQLCLEFETHLTQLSTDLKAMSKNWSSSRFKKYLNSNDIQDRIARFTREVNDLRANATFVAAAGTRLDLQSVSDNVAAVEAGVSDIRRELMEQRSALIPKIAVDSSGHELARYEEDFHALKLGDIHLEFSTARPAHFIEWDLDGNGERHTAWVDYRATVKGSVQTVRVYQGSDPLESWKGFLSFLAENSPSPHLPQLFGFCNSPRLRSLVFHGEFCPLDEYAKTLPTAQMIVDWELNLMSDLVQLRVADPGGVFDWPFHFALVNPKDRGKLPPFLEWFVRAGQWLINGHHALLITGIENDMKHCLQSIAHLRRVGPCGFLNVFEILTARGAVYHRHGGLVAELGSREITPEDRWNAVHIYISEPFRVGPCPDLTGWPDAFFPTIVDDPTPGFTHFAVPLLGESRRWCSLHDQQVRCGYFLSAEIEFGKTVPDISASWLAQASPMRSNPAFRGRDASEFVIPNCTKLKLTWEMVLDTQDSEFLATLTSLPLNIHVFVQIPILENGSAEEPTIYWSTTANTLETKLIPREAYKIRMRWSPYISVMRWESHHYEVAEKIQEEYGFDPKTSAAAESMGLPVLDLALNKSFDTASVKPLLGENGWGGYYERDPHSMQVYVKTQR